MTSILTATGEKCSRLGHTEFRLRLQNNRILRVPFEVIEEIQRPILSVSALADRGFTVTFGPKVATLQHHSGEQVRGQAVLPGRQEGECQQDP